MTIYGIDPGLSGGIGWTDGERSGAIPMRIVDGRPDLTVLADLFRERPPAIVVIETPSIRPKESGTSALTIGINWELIAGMLSGAGVPWQEARPDVWKRRLGLLASRPKKEGEEETEEAKKARLALAKLKRKEAAIALTLRLSGREP